MLSLRQEKHPQFAAGTETGECLETEELAGFGSLHQFAESLGNTVDAKDPLTFNHSQEVALISQALALAMGIPENEAVLIHLAGHLHDIGKIGVPDAICPLIHRFLTRAGREAGAPHKPHPASGVR